MKAKNLLTVKKLRKLLKEFDDDMLVMVPGDHRMYHYLDKGCLNVGVVEPKDGDVDAFEYDSEVHPEDYYEDESDDDQDEFAEWRRVVVLEG